MAQATSNGSFVKIAPFSRYLLNPPIWEDLLAELRKTQKLSNFPQMKSMSRALAPSPHPMKGKILIDFLKSVSDREAHLLEHMGFQGFLVPSRAVKQLPLVPPRKSKGALITASAEYDGHSKIIHSHIGTLFGSFEGEGSIHIFVSPDDGRGIWYLERNQVSCEPGPRGGWMAHVRFGNEDETTMDRPLPITFKVRVALFPLQNRPPDRSPVGNDQAFRDLLEAHPPIAIAPEFAVIRHPTRKIKVKSPKGPVERSPLKVEWEWEDGKAQGQSLFIELRWDGSSLPQDNSTILNGQELVLGPGRYELRMKFCKETCFFLYETSFTVEADVPGP